jgi:uncharacterized protein YacL
MTRRILQVIGAGVAIAAGVVTELLAKPETATNAGTFPSIAGQSIVWPWAVGIGLIVLVAPYLLFAVGRWIVIQIRRTHLSDLLIAAGGLIVGLLIAVLLAVPLSQVQPWHLNYWLPLLAAILTGYLGVAVTVLKRDELHRMLANIAARRRARDGEELDAEDRPTRRGRKNADRHAEKVVLDTSAIIDGRIAEISQTGFIMGTLVVPRFVLDELHRIADSADSLRRNRGRRGLDILNQLQKEENVPVEISEVDFDGVHEVDAKLVKLAKQTHSPIITNDYNLNKVAELQGVRVLNINELANAVKPALLPGEDMEVKIIQEGKELGQGVGYLDDGTMIVVEGGKPFMSTSIEVTVTRVLQTAAGRMIFAHPKAASANASTGVNANALRRTS